MSNNIMKIFITLNKNIKKKKLYTNMVSLINCSAQYVNMKIVTFLLLRECRVYQELIYYYYYTHT
jgi:hypothetical protein